MRACVALCSLFAASSGLTVLQAEPEQPLSDIQIPLKPITLQCSLSDIVTFSAPVVRDALYYLSRPDGSTVKLNITPPVYVFDPKKSFNTEYDSIIVKHTNFFKTIVPVINHNIFDLIPDQYGDSMLYEDMTKDLKTNDFVIGPLLEEDHGNWILSVYYEDSDEQMVELYQVITIEISVFVPANHRLPKLNPGDTFEYSFAYTIPYLESCELHAPRTSFDRFYERNMQIDMSRCGYVIKNVTAEDRGMWRITGVGKIVYQTQVHLEVNEANGTKKTDFPK